ncbi:CBO0543 family protein [Texcoconibacillus texcoconensis]|uniref:Uncharacterized protein n=1 Tax=Texcoconibacillus texcoconensis TaxID=1095777 RepID=A0A840QL09_9BACI|nr:CBO0543 family protein [Texcoconibacillus texcoconensis]MBB5171891.1 hypothetical protein [Texcoconibacillus texcoconensis]
MSKLILKLFLLTGLLLLPVAFKKKPVKDWLIVYLITALVSGITDHILVGKKLLSYPVRLLPRDFKYHILFDWLFCPLMSVFYNQFTYKDKSIFLVVGKLFLLTIPQLFIEVLAGRYFNMIRWKRGWKWYHTFITMNIKYVTIRVFMELIRKLSEKQKTEITQV